MNYLSEPEFEPDPSFDTITPKCDSIIPPADKYNYLASLVHDLGCVALAIQTGGVAKPLTKEASYVVMAAAREIKKIRDDLKI